MRALRYQEPDRRNRDSWPARAAIVIAGSGLLVMGLAGRPLPRWSPPPAPPSAPAQAAAGAAGGDLARPGQGALRHGPPPLRRSAPVMLSVPAIKVSAQVIPLGLRPDGEVAVPPLSRPFLTGWYDLGPAPGEPGPAVFLGHVDAAGVGPAVFYRLGDLRPGDGIYVTRKDGRTAVFRVTSVGLYSQEAFPARRVYQSTTRPSLRLITCGGEFDWATHVYLGRTIVFAAYAGSRL